MKVQQSKHKNPVNLFLSFSPADEALRERLEKHLSGLQREGSISIRHQHQIIIGMDRTIEAHKMLHSAALILLLISPDFIASDYCYGFEMQHALERQHQGNALAIPVLLRPVDWQHLPFASLQYLPRNGLPITSWPNEDEAFAQVVAEIRNLLAQLSPSLQLSIQTDRTNWKISFK